MNINWQTILNQVITFAIPLLVLFLLALLAGIGKFVKTDVWPPLREKMIQENHEREARLIDAILETAVSFAEQVGADNEDKKQKATGLATLLLARAGIRLSEGQLDDLIEATVYKLLKAGLVWASKQAQS